MLNVELYSGVYTHLNIPSCSRYGDIFLTEVVKYLFLLVENGYLQFNVNDITYTHSYGNTPSWPAVRVACWRQGPGTTGWQSLCDSCPVEQERSCL